MNSGYPHPKQPKLVFTSESDRTNFLRLWNINDFSQCHYCSLYYSKQYLETELNCVEFEGHAPTVCTFVTCVYCKKRRAQNKSA